VYPGNAARLSWGLSRSTIATNGGLPQSFGEEKTVSCDLT